MRATGANDIAVAPDRVDFGKFSDVFDIYFGRYSALVSNAAQPNNYENEDDWFDYSIGVENSAGPGNGHFDEITQVLLEVLSYGSYVQFWLRSDRLSGKSGRAAYQLERRYCGLPPTCPRAATSALAEIHHINRTRSRK